jgi:2-haloacid dehalogenase
VARRPDVIVFDVNETLSDMAPLAERFEQVGAPPHLAKTWFASILRDGFGLAAAGASAPFAEIASGVLRAVLAEAGVEDLDAGVEHVMSGMSTLDVHPDVPPGLAALRDAGLRLVTLTNGSVQNSEALLERAGVRQHFQQLLSVEDADVWKPARASYDYAASECGVPVSALMLVAVHPWDIDGAARAGLQTAWINRSGAPYPPYTQQPQYTVSGVDELVTVLG